MARHSRAQALEEDEPSLEISSLIDVCFLLLIYFIVTTTIKARETDTNMQLPAVAPPAQEALDSDPNNHSLPLLESRLSSYAAQARAIGQEPLVQIFVDGDAKHQRAIDVIDALRAKGISKVTFTDLIQ